MTFDPTQEQERAIELAMTGRNLAVEALAGAGKTSTLTLIADAKQGHGRYIAFNKKIVEEASEKFPRSVQCATAHSLAFRAVGKRYRDRLNSRRVTSAEVARTLGLGDAPWIFDRDEETIEIPTNRIATVAVQTVEAFCMSAELRIGRKHVPFMKGIDDPKGSAPNNGILAERVVPLAERIWDDLRDPRGGRFSFGHSHYLKLWHLEGPVIHGDFILFDEAQDANPLMMAIVEAQQCQRIYVGDSQQQIYSWNGAVNALERADVQERTYLTESFRFGPEIAEQANLVLRRLGAPKEVVGGGAPGRVGRIDRPDVYLGRTNGAVIEIALLEMERGSKVCVQGGTREHVYFAEEAQKLQSGVRSSHPDLAVFPTWGAVLKYLEEDDLSADLKTMVGLVDRYGAREMASMLARAVSGDRADVTVSTAHKSKGAEWDRVTLLGDFPVGDDAGEEELRLLYVAATRARLELDRSMADLEGIQRKPVPSLFPATLTPWEEDIAADDLRYDGGIQPRREPVQLLPITSPIASPRGESARARTVEEARAELGSRAWVVECPFCGVARNRGCRTKVTGNRTPVHVPRLEAAAAFHGILLEEVAS